MTTEKDEPGAQPGKGMRINKAMASAGVCSRRHADELVLLGRVQVNGVIVREPGLQLFSGDRLVVDGKPIAFEMDGAGHTYLMLNKPVEVVSTVRDPEGRRTVIDFLPPAYAGKRLFPVGRLDFFSEGLILLTDDGALTQRLTHPSHHLPKYYEVLVREAPDAEALRRMREGMTLAEGEKLAPVEVRRLEAPESLFDLDGRRGRGELLAMTLHQGVNRQIRRMCRDLGLTILRLRRVGQGPLKLGRLPSGDCRELEDKEIEALRKAVGL